MAFSVVTNAHGPSPQPTACRSPTCSLRTGESLPTRMQRTPLILFHTTGKKLRNGLKFSRVTVLPDTLCIHLKRFRHEFAFSSKVSTKVAFPLTDLDMSPWLHGECISKVLAFYECLYCILQWLLGHSIL